MLDMGLTDAGLPVSPLVRVRGSTMTIYKDHASSYDQATAMSNWLRRRAVERLDLRPGSTVIDVGCGTGLCFPYLQDAIGPTGCLVAIDESGPMLEQAMAAADRHGWRNITPVLGRAEDVSISTEADAVLFCAVHDVLRSPMAVKNILARVRSGGRVAAAGGKWPPLWLWPLHLVVAATHAPYVSSLDDFDRPWHLLDEHCTGLQVEDTALAMGYLAAGTMPTGDNPPGR
jgi:ubiquinone/menaquinone biosynthesis C-methylase UbiE